MAEEGGGGVIIVKGGSVQLSFDDTLYKKATGDPTLHKHDGRKITRVTVEDENKRSMFDSEVNKDGLKWTIKVFTE